MLSIVAFVVGGVFVVGFYGYVFVHLYGEYVKHRVNRQELDSHISVIKSSPMRKDAPGVTPPSDPRNGSIRNENLLNLAVAAFGLLGMIGEIFVLNGLLASSH